MQKFQFVLFQMDQAKNFIESKSLPSLRTALLLLDNSAEILLDHWISADLLSDGMFEQVQKCAIEVGIPLDHPQLGELLHRRFLSSKGKRDIARFFDEKIFYVVETKGKISQAIGKVLSHLHRYRNQAHHFARVRKETLYTSVVVYMELCCQLIELLQPSFSYDSSEDYTWLMDSFRLAPHDLMIGENPKIISYFRNVYSTQDSMFQKTLSENIKMRIEDFQKDLRSICEYKVAEDEQSAFEEARKYVLSRHPPIWSSNWL